jgi:predicted nucleic acid-binding protein
MNDDRDRPFLDTNILVYTIAGPPEKSDKSEKILSQRGIISVQVLNEFTTIARRKYHLSWPELHAIVESFQNFLEIVPLTTQTHQTAVNFAERYNLAFYDAVIAAAAHLAGCTILYTEDMHHTRLIENRLRITNPFAA